ncbi:MAG: shikimate kinase [Zhongshania sp.]
MPFCIFVAATLWHCDVLLGVSEVSILSMSEVVSSSVVLIGMPGAGKSTIGQALALRLGVEFVDTDRLIEQREGRSLQVMLDASGYQYLRAIEADVLLRNDFVNKVVATGGSAVYSDAAMMHLRRFGPCVFIDISLSAIEDRVQNFAERGIAGPPGQDLQGVYSERLPLYQRYADITVDGAGLDEASLLAEVETALAAYTRSGV